MVGLHQVQRMCIQYFSHSNNIQQTVQVGARLANGTHQTGYMQLHVEYNQDDNVQVKMTGDNAKKTLQHKNIHQYKLSNALIQGTNCSSLHLLAQFLQTS